MGEFHFNNREVTTEHDCERHAGKDPDATQRGQHGAQAK